MYTNVSDELATLIFWRRW